METAELKKLNDELRELKLINKKELLFKISENKKKINDLKSELKKTFSEKRITSFLFSSIKIGINNNFFFFGRDGNIFCFSKKE